MPNSCSPNKVVHDNTFQVYVDQNGDFYPDNWVFDYKPQPKNAGGKNGAYSLTTIAAFPYSPDYLTENLQDAKLNTLKSISEKFNSKDRVFIFVHGFNNNKEKADTAYNTLEKQIDFKPEDGLIKFYWDGLYTKQSIGALKIWKKACGYSQLAGERGLRSILNQFNNKEIIIISHSRGASVVLSALSDGPYQQSFIENTREYHNVSVHQQPRLSENNNTIKLLMLAPAVGYVDFREIDYYTNSPNSYRQFSDQIKSIHLTVNKNDNILKKYIKVLSDKHNPTDLGYNISTFENLSPNYPRMSMTSFDSLKSHDFNKYIKDDRFLPMLNKVLNSNNSSL